MKSFLVKIWNDVRESYWAMPSLMVVGSIVLSFVTTAVDSSIGSKWLEDVNWLYANKPAGARAVLSTVAGSMITVAGVTFSMTILSISYTAGQVGPRLLNNFMRDKSNQFTLGVFISTFMYCLMVLRTVRNADTPPPGSSVTVAGSAELQAAFVPHVAILIGLLMAVASVGVLIFFIHHIPESIHISNIVANVGRDLNRRLEHRFPAGVGLSHSDPTEKQIEANLPVAFYDSAKQIRSTQAGYVEYVDTQGLMRLARENDLVIRMRFRAGDFVTPRNVLMLVNPAERVNEELEKQLRQVFVCGSQRTDTQNLQFQFNQLVEVAMRALSPGVNDPFTAMNCMDWLQFALETCAVRELPDAFRYDDDGRLRIVAEPETFSAFTSLVFDQLRPYVSQDRNAAVHMMEMLAKLSITVPDNPRRRLLLRQASALRRACKQHLSDADGLRLLTERHRTLIWLLRDTEFRQHVLRTGNWIGGRG